MKRKMFFQREKTILILNLPTSLCKNLFNEGEDFGFQYLTLLQ
jgi:hypothetical protein